MSPRLTVRARLTLLYTGLFAVCGAIVVAISNILVRSLPETDPSAIRGVAHPTEFLQMCREALNSTDQELIQKCDAAFQEGVVTGATNQRAETLDHLLRYSLVALVAATLLAAVAGWIVAGRVLRPVHQITLAARSASQHNLSARVALSGPRDELRELADTFDDMLARLEAAFRSQRQFIANASHELRTPLTVMRTAVDVVLAKPSPSTAELVAMGEDVRSAVGRAEGLIDALLTLARNEYGLTRREQVDLATVAEDVADDAGGGSVRSALAPAIVHGDAVLLERLAANLVDNALRYNVPGGHVWVTTTNNGDRATLTVSNTGPVVAADRVNELFQPFRRLHERTASDGFGLGLAIVASIVAVHQGTVTATPRDGGGLTVTVTLPVAPAL